MNRKQVAIIFLILIGIIIFGFVFFWFTNKATVNISAPEGAEILISEDPNEEPIAIGTTRVTYKTRSSGTLYVFASKDDRLTQAATELVLRESTDISLNLKAISTRKAVAEGALAYMYFDKDFVYGINPETRSISYAPRTENLIPDVSFANVPYARKIAWTNTKNFTYKTYGSGVESVLENQTFDGIYTDNNTQLTTFIDFAKYKDRPIVLVNQAGIYTTTDFTGKGYKLLAALGSIEGAVNLFSDNSYIYYTNQIFIDADEGSEPTPIETKVVAYNYSGNIVTEMLLPSSETITKIVRVEGEKYFGILTENQFYIFDRANKSFVSTPYYFQNSRDILYVENRIIILNNKGLWEYEAKTESFYLISEFEQGEDYVANSLQENGGNLLFSSSASRDSLLNNSGIKNQIYQVNL